MNEQTLKPENHELWKRRCSLCHCCCCVFRLKKCSTRRRWNGRSRFCLLVSLRLLYTHQSPSVSFSLLIHSVVDFSSTFFFLEDVKRENDDEKFWCELFRIPPPPSQPYHVGLHRLTNIMCPLFSTRRLRKAAHPIAKNCVRILFLSSLCALVSNGLKSHSKRFWRCWCKLYYMRKQCRWRNPEEKLWKQMHKRICKLESFISFFSFSSF